MKSDVFENEYTFIKDKNIIESLKTLVNLLPDYFFEVGASSTGKYHPAFSQGKGGLVRHTKVAVRIAHELFENECVNNFTDREKDLMIFSLVVHDGLKHGLVHNEYTQGNHPLLISNFIKENKDKLNLKDEDIEFICNCVEKHMGQWTKDYQGNEILERPTSKYERFVHMCDYLSSKKFLDVKFENDKIVV